MQDSSVVANVEAENNGNQVLNEAEGNSTGTVNNLVRITLSLSYFFHIVTYICLN